MENNPTLFLFLQSSWLEFPWFRRAKVLQRCFRFEVDQFWKSFFAVFMQRHVADHFYVSITELLIKVDRKWSHNGTNLIEVCCLYCSLQQAFTVLREIWSAWRAEKWKNVCLVTENVERGNPDHLLLLILMKRFDQNVQRWSVCFVFFCRKLNQMKENTCDRIENCHGECDFDLKPRDVYFSFCVFITMTLC